MIRHSFLIAALVLALVCVCHLPIAAEPNGAPPACAGIIVSVDGDVAVHGAARERATEGFVLEEGDTVVVMVGGTCTGFTPVGEAFDIEGPAEIQLPVPQEKRIVDRVSGWIRSQLAEWIGKSRAQPLLTRSVLRLGDASIDVPTQLVPAPQGRVRPDAARLRWAGVFGIDTYAVELASSSGHRSERIARGHSIVIEGLTPGEKYVWKVRPVSDDWGGEARWRAFRVMEPQEERSLDLALQNLGSLETGVLLLTAGLHEEAIQRFDVAVSIGAKDHSARFWRSQALADVGLHKEAYEDLVKARGH